jgi:inner membrane protein
MMDFIQHLDWWHWWVLAAALAVFETFLPGAIAIWFAASALVVGALTLIMPVPWQLQLVLFGALGVAAILLWRRFRPQDYAVDSTQTLNQRGAQYLGQEFSLAEAISGGNGKIRVADTVWLVRGKDAPAGSRVRVVGIDGAILRVELI